ncbi:MAG: T9SS type A sorting domain-containing protein [Flavobacteriales bacterium]|nr:T9SS type A sorting domain-containing protein [Flavobacteriales bacterium]
MSFHLRMALFLLLGSGALVTSSIQAQECPAGPYSIGTSTLIPECGICGDYDWGTVSRHVYIDEESGLNYGNQIGPDDTHYHDQWLDLYLPTPPSADPVPVYIFAHAGGQYAADAFSNGRDFCEEGIAFVSWESVQSSLAVGGSYYENDPDLLMSIRDYWDAAHSDFDRVLTWVHEHAEEYGLDTENVFVGGGSRGSRISFMGLDDITRPVRGVFMTQAFADGDWFSQDMAIAEGCPGPSIPEFVSPEYPSMVLHYKNNLGDVVNSHDPMNGMIIQERYACYGIDSRIIHGLGDGYQWPPSAIEFILNAESYFDTYPEAVVDSLVIDPESNILSSPAPPEVSWENDMSTLVSFHWGENEWENNLIQEPYPNKEPEINRIEVRLGAVDGPTSTEFSDPCAIRQWSYESTYDHTSSVNSFTFPEEGLLTTCAIADPDGGESFSLDEGQYYGIQVRNNLAPSTNYFQTRYHKFWSPWSEMSVFEGRCSEIISDTGSDISDITVDIVVNPSFSGISIVGLAPIRPRTLSIDLLDITGHVVDHRRLRSDERIYLETRDLPSGIYLVRLSDRDSSIVKKVHLF